MKTMGWLPDLPDWRDYDAEPLLDDIDEYEDRATAGEPTEFDGRKYCSPIENQGRLGSCVAQAIVGLAEYNERRRFGRHVNGSRLFVYKLARDLDGIKGDSGAHIRTGMKALRLFGCPPERYWPYNVEEFDVEPTAMVYAYGQNLQGIGYHRIDQSGRSRAHCLALIKQLVVRWYPVVLGFSVYKSNAEGEFPMPEPGDRRRGGHAVMVCGFDDDRTITRTTGALLIRNSWGTRWGANGYGWLPYDYVLRYLSRDYWVLTSKESFMR